MDTTIKRRNFLSSLGAATVAVAATATATSVSAQGARKGATRRLKMVTSWPKGLPGLGSSAERLAKRIHDGTAGEIDIRVYAAGELVGPFEIFDAVSSGAADIYHGSEYYWQGKSPAFNYFTCIPFGMTADEMNAWVYFGGGQQLWDQLSAKFNVKAFLCSNTGHQLGGWFRKEIKSLDDLKGLKMRMPGLGGEVMRRVGAAAVVMPGGDIFPALQSGAIDACEWVGPWVDSTMGFYRVAKFYYWPGFQEPGSSIAFGMNLKIWNSFSPAQKSVIENACRAENVTNHAEYNHQNGLALDTLVAKHKVQLRKYPADVIAALRRESAYVVAQTAKHDAFTKRVYDSYMASMGRSTRWLAISDEPYLAARRGTKAPATNRAKKPAPKPAPKKAQ